MKHNHNHDNAPGLALELVPVRFEYTHPTAASVAIAGSFNQWKPEAKQLHPSLNGHWWKETALPPGTYEYCFIVDGIWMPDPRAQQSVPNPYGGANSILQVASPLAPAHRPAPKTKAAKTRSQKKD